MFIFRSVWFRTMHDGDEALELGLWALFYWGERGVGWWIEAFLRRKPWRYWKLTMAATLARARRSHSLLKLVLSQRSPCTYQRCGLASLSAFDGRRAIDSSARLFELSLWRNYLNGLMSARSMATFNRKWVGSVVFAIAFSHNFFFLFSWYHYYCSLVFCICGRFWATLKSCMTTILNAKIAEKAFRALNFVV